MWLCWRFKRTIYLWRLVHKKVNKIEAEVVSVHKNMNKKTTWMLSINMSHTKKKQWSKQIFPLYVHIYITITQIKVLKCKNLFAGVDLKDVRRFLPAAGGVGGVLYRQMSLSSLRRLRGNQNHPAFFTSL